jgi:hypothetical protein
MRLVNVSADSFGGGNWPGGLPRTQSYFFKTPRLIGSHGQPLTSAGVSDNRPEKIVYRRTSLATAFEEWKCWLFPYPATTEARAGSIRVPSSREQLY